jgi:hypothetical protein
LLGIVADAGMNGKRQTHERAEIRLKQTAADIATLQPQSTARGR